jgi:2-methylisocitrate lyase-like PEP mutase family enzyme
MTDDQEPKANLLLALHNGPGPLVMPNCWDAGSARILTSLGFKVIATTSSGFAATLGLPDGAVSRDQALAHCTSVVAATGLPVCADLESGFGRDLDDVAETYQLARATGLAGASIEDYDRESGEIYPLGLARERVAAAAEALHAGGPRLVLTGRAENYIYGHADLADTIARLQAYQEAGADVLFAPLMNDPAEIRSTVESVDRPVSVLLRPDGPTVAELAALGVARVSVGGGLAFAALGAAVTAAREVLEKGTLSWYAQARVGSEAARAAFS